MRLHAALVQLADLSTRIKLPKGRKLSFREDFNEAGFVTVTLDNDDPGIDSVVFPNTLLNYYIDDTLAFTGLLEKFHAVDLGEEEADEETTYEGRGHLALLDRIVWYPGLGVGRKPVEQQRSLNYTANAYDDTAPVHYGPELAGSWDPATELATVAAAKLSWGAGGGAFDASFPDDTASALGPSDFTDTTGTAGDYFGRQPFTLTDAGSFTLFGLIDNYGEIYIDGVLMLTPGQEANLAYGFEQTSQITIDLSAGDHLLAWKMVNAPDPSANNPGAVAYALYASDVLGSITGSPVMHSDTSCLIVGPSPGTPGMTPGQAILIGIAEAQVRAYDDLLGIAVLVSCSFDKDYDSNGDAWPVYGDIATKCGTTLFAFLRELSATYIDFYMAPGTLVLDAWIKGGRGDTPDIGFTTGVNLTGLERTGEV